MKKAILICSLTIFCCMSNWAYTNSYINAQFNQQTDDVTATITKTTTDKQLEDLKNYFSENDIVITLNNVERNDEEEIIGLSLSIKKGNQQSSYNMNSNIPIENLELGYRKGNVFVGSIESSFSSKESISLQNLINGFNQGHTKSLDSLLSQNQFSFTFGSDDIRKLLGDANFDFNQIQDQFFNQFFGSNATPNSNKLSQNNTTSIPKYSFFNTKNSNKLIIIDGEESNYETLNTLAKADKLKEVDNLKPSTAISIYGEKAANGAIIAISK